MSFEVNAEFVWVRGTAGMEWMIRPKSSTRNRAYPSVAYVKGDRQSIPIRQTAIQEPIVYRCPTTMTVNDGRATVGPVFAILAGDGVDGFTGARLNFRDIMEQARRERIFVYVLSPTDVNENGSWQGYVRLGHKRWQHIPCPAPQAIYNRIPTRVLERKPNAVRARTILRQKGIPMFNPEYFSKSRIYEMIRAGGLDKYLPETVSGLTETSVVSMLKRHPSIYLKPSGGSVGHGMIRISLAKGGWDVSVLKNGRTKTHLCQTTEHVWRTVDKERVRGQYVIQQAIPLIEYRGNACDFRILLQKHKGTWNVVGRGVRVSGAGRITTHVPNGGSIAAAGIVLDESFGTRKSAVEEELDEFVLAAAMQIDRAYQGQLGEMSMDIGIDAQGHPWFFEANAKPMKFDEPDIRKQSLQGVLDILKEKVRTAK